MQGHRIIARQGHGRGLPVSLGAALLLALSALVACAAPAPAPRAPTTAPTPAPATQAPSATPTAPPTPTRTVTPSPEATATPALLALSAPELDRLEQEGYATGEIAPFFIGGRFSGLVTADFDTKHPLPPQLNTTDSAGRTYTYLQYSSAEANNCHLVFFVTQAGQSRLIADLDVSRLTDRIDGPFKCGPLGNWGDINRNGKPDLVVVLIWGNRYTGCETHIFEVAGEDTIVDLTAGLPGVVSPVDVNPQHTDLVVIDDIWAKHDCIYPPIDVFWVYDWNGEAYVDVTPEYDLTDLAESDRRDLASVYGQPFDPTLCLRPIVSVLLIYDKMGQRDKGWQAFLEMTDLSHWPGTDAAAQKWLASDVAHFRAQYEAGQPFTPNDYCGQ